MPADPPEDLKSEPSMTPAPRVSVVLPAYNRNRYIREACDSVLDQDWPDIELIVVDDGSTDGTWETLQSYGDRITLLSHDGRVNKGQSAAINLGLKHVTGKYVAILDSDDYWLPGKLRCLIPFLEAHPEVGLVYTNGYGVDETGTKIYDFLPADHVEPNDPNAVLLDCYTLLPNNSIVRKTAMDEAGEFEESFRAAQDHDMLIRLAEVTQLAYVPEFLFCYRRHGESISAKGQEARWNNGFVILERAAARYPYNRSTIRKRRALLNYRMAQVWREKRRPIQALLHFLKAGLLDPLRSARVLLGVEKST
jgi:glycosyltransferase involved in cell wall biosynthesis